MKAETITLDETGCFSPIFLDYLAKKDSLRPFYGALPEIASFKELIEKRAFDDEKRTALYHALKDQYIGYKISDQVQQNIQSLYERKTFTVTTGHQLNIFTGPLYFLYKIVTVINACKQLRIAYPEHKFVPVYWMASEDHDVAEISYFYLFGKKYTWETEQKGPVGRFKPHSLDHIIQDLPEKVEIFEKAYLDAPTLAGAVRWYVNELFGNEGLLVVDGDDQNLKSFFAPIVKRELFENNSHRISQFTSTCLTDAGYGEQAFSREINLFYLETGLRERIERHGDRYTVLNTGLSFSHEELESLVDESPEKFSPNVILRPLYQETILPNLAYIGGPAEIAYWLQLKGIFDFYGEKFPALMPRNFAVILNKGHQKRMEALEFSVVDLFQDTHKLKEAYLTRIVGGGFDLVEESKEIELLFEKIQQKAKPIDGSLTGFIAGEAVKTLKSLEMIEKRLKKSEERNNETALNQIQSLKDKLFPGGGLQERHDNFLNFYLNQPDFIEQLKKTFDPFRFEFYILKEE